MIASNLACSIDLRLRFRNLPHSVEQITCHLLTHYFSVLSQNSPKKVPQSFICMFVDSSATLTCFGGFLVEEVRLFLTIHHSGPLMTRSMRERESGRCEVWTLPRAQISVSLQVNEVWMSGTNGSSWHRSPNTESMWRNSDIPTEHVTHSAPEKSIITFPGQKWKYCATFGLLPLPLLPQVNDPSLQVKCKLRYTKES